MARNILSNDNFELGTGDAFTDWTLATAGSSTITEETTDVFSGSRCVRLTVDGSANTCYIYQTGVAVVGQPYRFSFWAKKVSGTGNDIYCSQPFNPGTITNLTTEWKKFEFTGVATDTGFIVSRYDADMVFLVDKARLEPLVRYAVMTRPLSDDIASPDTDFFVSDFGTPKATIVFMSNGNTISNPEGSAVESVGFLDDSTSQVCAAAGSYDAQATSSTYRSLPTSRVAKANYSGSTICDYSAATVVGSGVTITMETDATGIARYATVIMITGPDVESDVGVFNPSNGEEVTLVGFQPTALLVAGVGLPFGAANGTNNIWSFGGAIWRPSTVNRSVNVYDAPTASTMNNNTYMTSTQMSMQITTSISWSTAFTAFTGDGLKQTVTGSTAGDYVGYLALKIPGVNVDIRTIHTPGSTGNYSVTGVGFKPAMVIAAMTAGDPDAFNDHIRLSFGASDGTTEGSYGVWSTDAVSVSEAGSKYSASLINLPSSSGEVYGVATINSFDTDGYTLNWSDVSTSGTGFAIAFQDHTDTKKLIGTASGKIYFKQ